MKEIWEDIEGCDGYQVSNLGRVKSLKWSKTRVLKNITNCYGYQQVTLNGTTLKVHQLVAIAFLNHTPCGMKLIIDHIDNDKTNNRLDNIRIVTSRQNSSKDRRGRSKYVGVHWSNKKWRASIRIDGKAKHLGYFKCELAAAKAYNDKLKEINE